MKKIKINKYSLFFLGGGQDNNRDQGKTAKIQIVARVKRVSL